MQNLYAECICIRSYLVKRVAGIVHSHAYRKNKKKTECIYK